MPDELERTVGNTTIGSCAGCSSKVNAQLLFSHKHAWDDEHVSGIIDYQVLKCGGCGAHYYKTIDSFSENADYEYGPNGETITIENPTYSYWPPSNKREPPKWLTELGDAQQDLVHICLETYSAFTANNYILTCIGLRTAFDVAVSHLGITDGTFSQKLTRLCDQGLIDTNEKSHLEVLTEAGNAAAHRAWHTRDEGEISTLFSVLETFLYKHFIAKPKTESLNKAIRELSIKVPRRSAHSK